MKNALLQDKIFRIYTKLPHCVLAKRKHLKDIRSRFDYKNLSDISIFSSNCVGGEIYTLLGIEFLSPLINISINRDEFVVLCTYLKEYMKCPLRVSKAKEGNCIAALGDESIGLKDIEIRFPHDTDPDKVRANWERRCSRINFDKLVLINDDKGLKEEDYVAYDKIQGFRKICLTAQDRSQKWNWCHQIEAYKDQKMTGEYNGKSLDGLWNFTKIWDYVSFLNGYDQ